MKPKPSDVEDLRVSVADATNSRESVARSIQEALLDIYYQAEQEGEGMLAYLARLAIAEADTMTNKSDC